MHHCCELLEEGQTACVCFLAPVHNVVPTGRSPSGAPLCADGMAWYRMAWQALQAVCARVRWEAGRGGEPPKYQIKRCGTATAPTFVDRSVVEAALRCGALRKVTALSMVSEGDSVVWRMGSQSDSHRGGSPGDYLSTYVISKRRDRDSESVGVRGADNRSSAGYVCVRWKRGQTYNEASRGCAFAFVGGSDAAVSWSDKRRLAPEAVALISPDALIAAVDKAERWRCSSRDLTGGAV